MNNLAEVCVVELGVGRNYERCLVIVVISIGLRGTKRCGRGFKVINLRGVGKVGNLQIGDQFLRVELIPLYTMKGILTM